MINTLQTIEKEILDAGNNLAFTGLALLTIYNNIYLSCKEILNEIKTEVSELGFFGFAKHATKNFTKAIDNKLHNRPTLDNLENIDDAVNNKKMKKA